MKRKNILFLILISFMLIYLLVDKKKDSNIYSISEIGIKFNNQRKELNIPLIERDWILKKKSKTSLKFISKDSMSNGHICKIIYLSKSDNGVEYDFFNINKDIYITVYARNIRKGIILKSKIKRDSMSYVSVSIDDKNTILIDPSQANYLFKNEKIEFIFGKNWMFKYFN